MKEKILNYFFILISLLIVVLLLTVGDYAVHELKEEWAVPEYYFSNKILFGYFWAVLGYLISTRFQNIWLKALSVSGTIAVALQFRYFFEGYPIAFVIAFLLIHFAIAYIPAVAMFFVFNKVIISNKQ